MSKERILKETRQALFDAFGDCVSEDPNEAKKLIERHTHFGEDAPGGWAPKAIVVILAECIPLPEMSEVPQIDAWMNASAKINGGFIEHINNAVAAVWPE